MLTPGGGCSVESFLESRSTSRRTVNNLGAFLKMMNVFSSKTESTPLNSQCIRLFSAQSPAVFQMAKQGLYRTR